MASIERRIPSVDEYLDLRRSLGWKVPGAIDAERALQHSTATLCAVEDGEAVGMGRLVGDGAFYLFVVDLMVRPEHQHRGIGSRLLSGLEAEATRTSATGSLALVAERDVVAFYERQGFGRATGSLFTKNLERAPTSGKENG